MADNTSPVPVYPNDPLYEQRRSAFQALNDISLQIRDTRDRISDTKFYALGVLIAIPLAFFAGKENWIIVIILAGLFISLVLYRLGILEKRHNEELRTGAIMKEQAIRLGMQHPALMNQPDSKIDKEKIAIILSLASFMGTYIALGAAFYIFAATLNPLLKPSDIQVWIFYIVGIAYMFFGLFGSIYAFGELRKAKIL